MLTSQGYVHLNVFPLSCCMSAALLTGCFQSGVEVPVSVIHANRFCGWRACPANPSPEESPHEYRHKPRP